MRSTLTTRTVDGNRLLQSKHSTHHIVLVSSTCTKGVSYAQIHVHGVTGASRILVAGRDVPSRLLVTTHSGIKYQVLFAKFHVLVFRNLHYVHNTYVWV